VFKTLKTNQKVKYNNFLHEVARSWIFSFNELQWPEKQPTPLGPKHATPSPDRLYRDFSNHKWDKIVAGEEGQEELSCKRL